MTIHIASACLSGFFSLPVTIEVQTQNGLPRFSLIGLGDSAVKESRERVLAALTSLRLLMPDQILVNLSPAEERKSGSSLDLGIAIGIAAAAHVFDENRVDGFSTTAFIGELSLSGELRPIKGIAAHAARLHKKGIRKIFCPLENVTEAKLISGVTVYGCGSLADVIAMVEGGEPASELPNVHQSNAQPHHSDAISPMRRRPTFDDVIGQSTAKRALIIAASGGHHVLFSGPPGCGKTMLAEAFTSILPPLTEQEVLETVTLHSVAGLPIEPIVQGGERPFRSPHYNVSQAGLIGGGSKIRPGEVSLAHNGILFLDELPEFSRSALESLRIPLESGKITVSRALGTVNLPANFLLVAAMNPCPCGVGKGEIGEKKKQSCSCSSILIDRYIKKISQPILDRIDMKIALQPVPINQILEKTESQDSPTIKRTVDGHRNHIKTILGALPSTLSTAEIFSKMPLQTDANKLLQKMAEHQSLSGRGLNRIVRLAATISLMERKSQTDASAIAEACSLRQSISAS